MSEPELNRRQEQFVTYYLTEPSATRAAIMAGYGEKNARSQASTLLRNPAVVARVAALRREERLRYRMTKDDAHDWYEAAKQAAFAAGNWREVRLNQDRQCQLEFILPHAGGARRLGPADMQRLAEMTADAMLNRGAPMEAIQSMSWDGVRRVRDEKLRREAREARIAEYEKTVRNRMNDGKLPYDPAAFMPTADEQEKAEEEKAELDALKAQPGAIVGPLKAAAPPPPPPVVAEWTPPPLPDNAEERMAAVMAATDSSPSPLRGEGEESMGEEEDGGGDGEADPDKTRQNPTKPYTGESRVFAATKANGAPVDAGAPLDERRMT